MTMGGLAVAILAALPLGLLAAPAGAQPYPPGACSLALSLSVASPGQLVTVSTVNCDSGYAAGASVTLTFASDPVVLKTIDAGANGQFSTEVTLPADASAGAHTISSSGLGADGSTLTLSAPITVVVGGAAASAGAGGGSGQLAFTGGWVLAAIAIALVSLTVGTALVVGSRRRAEVRRQFS